MGIDLIGTKDVESTFSASCLPMISFTVTDKETALGLTETPSEESFMILFTKPPQPKSVSLEGLQCSVSEKSEL